MTSSSEERLAKRPLNIVREASRTKNRNSNINHLSPNDTANGYNSVYSSSSTSTSEILRRSSLNNFNNTNLCRHNSSDSSSRRLSLSRDPVQPNSGSLSSLKCRSLPPEREEDDVIGSLAVIRKSCQSLSTCLHSGINRPRAYTCSDLDTKKLRNKIRNRPPTPPPKTETNSQEDSSSIQFSKSFDSSLLNSGLFGNCHNTFQMGRKSRHSSRDRLELNNIDDLLPAISES